MGLKPQTVWGRSNWFIAPFGPFYGTFWQEEKYWTILFLYMSLLYWPNLSPSLDFQVSVKRHLSSKLIQMWNIQHVVVLPVCSASVAQTSDVFCCVSAGNSSTAGGRSEEGEGASHRGESVCLSLSISISTNESALNTSPWALGKYENINWLQSIENNQKMNRNGSNY